MTDTSVTNPYASPQADVRTSTEEERERQRVLAAARGQRHANLLILVSFGMYGLSIAQIPRLGLVVAVLQLAYVLLMAIIIFRAVRGLHGTVRAVIYALVSWVPLLNLLLLVSISSTATRLLRQHGFKVGLLGVDVARVQAWVERGTGVGQMAR